MSKIGNKVVELCEQGYTMEEITNGQIELGTTRQGINTSVTKSDDELLY